MAIDAGTAKLKYTGLLVILLSMLVPAGKRLQAHGEIQSTVNVVVWKYHLVGQEEYYRALAQGYERAHPGHHVVIHLEDWNSAHDHLREWIKSGNGPDLTIVPDVWLSEFASGLDPYPDVLPASFLRRFNPTMLDRSRLNGRDLGLVWAASTKVLFYRTDLFHNAGLTPPSTWRQLLIAAQTLSRPRETYSLAIPGASALDTADNFYFFLWSDGGRLVGDNGRSSLDSPQAVESLNFLRDLALKYQVTEPNPESCDRPCAEELFANGKAAMVETGPWLIQTIAAKPHPVPFAVTPLPSNRERATQLVTDHLVLLTSSPHKQEALQFVQFAYQPSWRMRWARLGMVPELKSVEQSAMFTSDPVWRVFVDGLQDARWIPIVKWQPIDLAISQTVCAVLAGRSTPANALDALSKRVDQLLAQ